MKKKGLVSPDGRDMLAMSFAVEIAPPPQEEPMKYWETGSMESSWMT